MTEITPFTLQLFESTPGNSALIEANPLTYTVIAITDGYERTSETPRNAIIGKGLFTVFPSNPDQLADAGEAGLKRSFEEVIRSKAAHVIEAQRHDVLNAEDMYVERYWTIVNKPIFGDGGEVAYILHTAEEITDKILAERAEIERARLTGANAYLQRIIDIFNAPLQVLEPVFDNGTITDFRFNKTNLAYAAYANASPREIEGKRVSEIFPSYLQTSSFTNIVKVFQTGIPETWEIHYNQDGLDIYNTMSATKMDNEIIVHFTEFTKLKNLQVELEKKIVELQRSNNHLEAFAYAASHDLKEPVRKIRVFTGLLRQSLGSRLIAEERQYLERMDGAAERMYTLIDDLLTYSAISQQPEAKQAVDLNAVLSEVLTDLDLEIEQKGAHIKTAKLFTVYGYHHQLKQVLQNLVGNALKYSRPNVPPFIDIRCDQITGGESGIELRTEERAKAYCQITVKDNGIGFSQDDAARIFNMFTRLHGRAEYQGTGIGLTIVRKVIENHGGHIWAESQPGEGATFKVLLPCS